MPQPATKRLVTEAALEIAKDEIADNLTDGLATREVALKSFVHGLPIWMYGNSYAAWTINASLSYFDRLLNRLNSPFPQHGNWGIPGTLAGDMCTYMFGNWLATVQWGNKRGDTRNPNISGTWVQNADASLGTNGIVILECVRNDAGLDGVVASGGTTAKSRAGFKNALDAMIRCIRSKSRVENTTAAGWVESGVWTNSSGFASCSGSTVSYTTAAGAKRTITITGDCDLILLGLDDSALSVVGAAYRVKIDGVVFATGTTSDQHRKTGFSSPLAAGGNYGFCQMAVPIRGLAPGSHSLEIEHIGSNGQYLYLDCILYPRDNTAYPPPTIIVPKNPNFTTLGYAQYTALGGVGAGTDVDDIYDGIIDTVLAAFPDDEVIAWDPKDHGFDPDVHIGNKDGAHVHLSDFGTIMYSDSILFDIINEWEPRDGLIRI